MTSLTCHKTDKGRSRAHCPPPPPSTALRHHRHHYHRQRARASPQQLHRSLSKESLITALWNVTPRRTQLLYRCLTHTVIFSGTLALAFPALQLSIMLLTHRVK